MKARFFRRYASSNDRERAALREESALEGALASGTIDPRFRAEMLEAARDPNAALVGFHAEDPSVELRLDLGRLVGQGHALCLGATASGKTRAMMILIAAMLVCFALDPSAPRPWIVDYKGDMAALALLVAENIAASLGPEARERFLRALVVVNPFSTEALVPLQVLARPPGAEVDEETLAFDVATLFERLVGADLGVKQDAVVYHLILLGVSRGMSLPELPRLLNDPALLASAAASCTHPQVRSFFGPSFRMQAASVSGLQARFTRITRLPSNRLMLSAPGCLDFRAMLRDKVVIANFGNPPLGGEEQARFFGNLFNLKTTRAIFDRPDEEARRKVLIVTDEWQEGLSGGREIADNYERVLAMSRSKGVGFLLVSQSLAGAAKISSSLPRVVATNTALQMLFRASIEDARAMTHLLPATGRRLRGAPLPWEGRRESPFYSRAEELTQLVEEVASLPKRVFYYWNRDAPVPYRAQRIRTADMTVERPDFLPEDLARRVRVGSAAIPIRELEAYRAELEAPDEPPAAEAALFGPARRRGTR